MADDEVHGAEPQDQAGDEGAAEAFEALRAEVAQLRASVAALTATFKGPDFAPTLGAMAQSLAAIEAHPALQIAPESFASQLRQARETAQQQGQRELASATQRFDSAAAELERVVARARAGHEQNRWLAVMTGFGVVVGVVVWVSLSGPLARTLPASWRVPEKMAAATLHLDRWAAGSQLMRTVDPASWNALVAASGLWRDNVGALEACREAAARAARPQRCTVTVEAPSQGANAKK
jgi:hypothetical protein